MSTTRTVQQDQEAARRLMLPPPSRWSVSEAQEAEQCVGCVVEMDGDVRIIRTVSFCPVHTGPRAA